MTRAQRRRHLVIWAVLTPVLLAVLAVAAWMNPARGQRAPADAGVTQGQGNAGDAR